MSNFWNKFYQRPLDKIPWQNTQADWFIELADKGMLNGQKSLDLGCGTGMKSIYLAEKLEYERCVGIDIAPKAIDFAKENANKHNVTESCEFICHDVTDLSFLGDEQFDLVIDWAAIHCISPNMRQKYAEQIDQHCATGSKLLIRSFANKNQTKAFFEEAVEGVKDKVYFLSEVEFEKLFSNFSVLDKNTSRPKTKPDDFYFIEILFEKK